MALFTAASAVSVTGPAVVDTAADRTGFGRGVILALIEVGGFGIMSRAALLGLVVASALALRPARGHGMAWRDAAWHGLLQAVSAFSNAGFSTWSDSLVSFAGFGLMLGPIRLAVVPPAVSVLGLGVPAPRGSVRPSPRPPDAGGARFRVPGACRPSAGGSGKAAPSREPLSLRATSRYNA